MTRYELISPTVEATQWFKNGDHPEDNSKEIMGSSGPFLSEGNVVRRYRRPDVPGNSACKDCGEIMHKHGWIDQDVEFVVCPGDFVVDGINGLYIVVKPEWFLKRFKDVIDELISGTDKHCVEPL